MYICRPSGEREQTVDSGAPHHAADRQDLNSAVLVHWPDPASRSNLIQDTKGQVQIDNDEDSQGPELILNQRSHYTNARNCAQTKKGECWKQQGGVAGATDYTAEERSDCTGRATGYTGPPHPTLRQPRAKRVDVETHEERRSGN